MNNAYKLLNKMELTLIKNRESKPFWDWSNPNKAKSFHAWARIHKRGEVANEILRVAKEVLDE